MAEGVIMEVEGMLLKIGDGASPEVFTTIAGVKEIPKFNKAKTKRDRTETRDTQQQIHPGMEQAADFTMTLTYYGGNTNQELLYTDWTNETARNFKTVGSDSPATEWTFTAKTYEASTPGNGIDADAEFDINFVCTVNPTLT